MEELKQLRLQEKILRIKLKAIQDEISLIEETLEIQTTDDQTVHSVKTTNPLKADALPKSSFKDTLNPDPLRGKISKLVINEPQDQESKSLASPGANGTGKDLTNPLSPVALGKSKMTVLNPPPKSTDLVPDYLKAANTNTETFYVVYTGSNKGIYTDWATAQQVSKDSKSLCKRFKSLSQAQTSFALSQEKTPGNMLRPSTRGIQKRKESSPEIIKGESSQSLTPCSMADFKTLWSKARNADQDDLIAEKFCTDDKKTRSLFVFTEGSDPSLVYLAFTAGLVKLIYPSSNLQELRLFPEVMVKAIKNFRKKVLKAKDTPIFIKISSSIPDWSQGAIFNPYYYMEIGMSSSKRELPTPKAMDDTFPSYEGLIQTRCNGLKSIIDKIIKVEKDSKMIINYSSRQCVMTSWCPSTITKEDYQQLCQLEASFFNNELMTSIATKKSWCHVIKGIFRDHLCDYCTESNNEKASEDSCNGSPLTNAYHERDEAVPTLG